MFTVILFNSSGCELDRKTGDTAEGLLKELADEGCLSGGDTIKIIENEDA